MSIALIDFLLDCIEPNFLPSFECAVIVCNDNCKVNESVSNNFCFTDSVEILKNGGCFVVKVKHEVQRGFLINYLNNALKPTVFSHRPETLAKILNLQVVLPLMTPDRTVKKPLKNVDMLGKIVDHTSEPQEKPIKGQEIFTKIYQESFDKYVKIILTTPNKAEKNKSFKAQIRNIVEGIITSNQKKSGLLIDFTADKVTESIINDLEGHEIIRFGSSNVSYSEMLIEQFFGKNKSKMFIPGFNIAQNIEINKGKNTDNKVGTMIKDWEKSVYEYCVSDSEIFDSKTIGELYYLVYMGIIHCCKKDLEKLEVNEIDVIEKVLKNLMTDFFVVEKMSANELMKDVHLNFSQKIQKKLN